MKRIIVFVVFFALICLDVWLYFMARDLSGNYLLYFGLSSAIGIPFATSILFSAIEWGNRENLSKLTKLSEIDELIKKAETAEEKYDILNEEYKKLEDVIKLESEKYYLKLRLKEIQNKSKELLEEYEQIEHELKIYDDVKTDNISKDTIENLRRKISARKTGNIIIPVGKKEIEIESKLFRPIPIFGSILELYLIFFGQLVRIFNRVFNKKR